MRVIIVILLTAMATACETVQFYRQATVGQWGILQQRVPTARMLATPDTNAVLRAKLVEVAAMLQFAQQRLSLEPERQYSSYVRLDGPYVIWNVFATPEFSTRPKQWCYPIVGCAAYRGYFHVRDARRFARRLAVTQHDTVVGGVAAYSTLGWFDDPLLSTFMNWRGPELAGLIFHELAHGRVFVGGDTSFNEALATFVERRGVLEWLKSEGDQQEIERSIARWGESDRFVQYLLLWRRELQRLYDQPYSSAARRLLKAELMGEVDRCYRANRELLGGGGSDWFFRQHLNNARLVPLATYHELVTGFAGVFADSKEHWQTFFSRAIELGRIDARARAAKLKRFADAYVRQTGIQTAPAPIQCQTLEYDAAN